MKPQDSALIFLVLQNVFRGPVFLFVFSFYKEWSVQTPYL